MISHATWQFIKLTPIVVIHSTQQQWYECQLKIFCFSTDGTPLLLDRGCLVSVTSLEQRYALRNHDGTWHLFSLRERAIVFLDSSWQFKLSPPLAVVASKDSLNLFPGFAPSHFWLGFHCYMITILILITCKNVWFDFGGKLKTSMSGLTRSISLSVCDYGLKKASGFWKRGDFGFMRVRFIEVPLY